MFGPHLMLDCYGCNKEKLNNEKFILDFLKKLPNELDMHIIKDPFIVPYKNNPETWDNGGISAVVLIAESHISIHTFPGNNGFMSVDIFSCKEFDTEKTIKIITEYFGPIRTEKNIVMRGRHFSKEISKVSKTIIDQRIKVANKI